jgi:RNA polymerase sigma-70 factor (ECF subfamily)
MPERTVNEEDYDRIEELIDFEDVANVIREALSDLSEDQREALTLRVIDGRSYREVAEALGCTEQTARARVSRGLKQMAKQLDAADETDTPTELERERWKRRSAT